MSEPALVLGTFDLIHDEHLYFLSEAARLGPVVVALGTDKYQRGYKRPPVLSYEERKRVLERLPMVAQVVAREEVSIEPVLDAVRPKWVVAGVDWAESAEFLRLSGITVNDLARRHINLVYICSPRHISTSDIIGRVLGSAERHSGSAGAHPSASRGDASGGGEG